MKQARVTKRGTTWRVEGLIGMSPCELASTLDQVLTMQGLSGDTKVELLINESIATYSVSDLANTSVRALIAQKL